MAEPVRAAELATPASATATGVRVTPVQLHAWLEAGEPVLVLDVRGREQWTAELERIPGATWMPIEELSRRAWDLPGRRLVVYCSSPGEARSARTARWLEDHGHRDVFVLSGGLAAWRSAGLPVETMRLDLAPEAEATEQAPGLPTLLEQYRRAGRLPTRVRLATLFVDIVGSMRLLAHHPPEQVLAFVQRFMGLVTEVALAYCGDVKDFEGDGALLYFDSTAEAASAALAIRDALAGGRECADAACPVSARLSLTVGDVVLGEIGAAGRRAVALVGPSVGIGARLLKQIEPGGIIASGEVVEELRDSAPELAARCRLLHAALAIPGADGVRVAAYAID
jgi:class 3 adenylate cyclase